MKRSSRMMILIIAGLISSLTVALLVWLMMPDQVQATTCDVPSGLHTTIQSAVNDTSCDVINLITTLYTENVAISRTVTIQGQSTDTTTVDGNHLSTVFTIQPGQYVTLTKIAIINGQSWEGGAIYNDGSTVVLSDTLVLSNTAAYGGGIYSTLGTVEIFNSKVMSNHSNNGAGGGILIEDSELIITNSELSYNSANGGGGAIYNQAGIITISNSSLSTNSAINSGRGGGIFDFFGTVAVDNSVIMANSADWQGGAIWTYQGEVTILSSLVTANYGGQHGGAFYNAGTLNMTDSTLISNTAGLEGGAISNGGVMTITNSLLSHNSVQMMIFGGGAIANRENSRLRITNSTLSRNAADKGGGIYNLGTITSTNNTLNENTAVSSGGGIYNDNLFGDVGMLHLSNSIIANSPSGGDCYNIGTIASNVNNLVEDGSCSPASSGDPLLGPLQDNGGSTLTHALLTGSPAIDAGDSASCPANDQRGVVRPLDGDGDGTAVCDIGAFELAPTIAIADNTVIEGNETLTATFAVTLSFSSTLPVTVTYETVDDTAVSPNDYTSISGTLTFAPGETSQMIHVLISGDLVQEDTETFLVNLSNPIHAAFNDSQATGTILNDDYQVFLPILLKP